MRRLAALLLLLAACASRQHVGNTPAEGMISMGGGPGRKLAAVYVPLPNGSVPTAADFAARFWALDPLNSSGIASDGNACTGTSESDAALRPCLTWTAIMNRMAGANYAPNIIVEIFLMSDIQAPVSVPGNINMQGNDQLNGFGGFLAIVGKRTVIRSGTLTAGTAAQSGNSPQTIVDSTLASTWTAANAVSDGTHSVWIRDNTVANCHAEVQFDAQLILAKSAHTSQPVAVSEVPGQQIGSTDCAMASGDAYDLYTLPKLAGITVGGSLTLRLYELDIASPNANPAQIGPNGSSTYLVLSELISGVIIFSTVREYSSGHYASTVAQTELTVNNGCWVRGSTDEGIPGAGDTWVDTGITTAGKFTISRGFINFNGGDRFTQNLEIWRLFLWDDQPDVLNLNAPGAYFFDTIAGTNRVGHDKPIRIQSPGVHVWTGSPNFSFTGNWTINLFGGFMIEVAGKGVSGAALGLGVSGFADLPWVRTDIDTSIDVYSTNKTDFTGNSISCVAKTLINAGLAVTADCDLADSTDGTKVAIGIVKPGCANATQCDVITSGIAQNVLSGATAKTRYWLSTAGALTTTKPAVSGRGLTTVGYAINATDLYVQITDLGTVP